MRKTWGCCQFILEKADTILAADYLTDSGKFLYAQAVKDHFYLPVTLPDEDEKREDSFYEVIEKIAKEDITLSINIYNWCLNQFLPYAKYDEGAADDMELYNSDEYLKKLAYYMDRNVEFRKKLWTTPQIT